MTTTDHRSLLQFSRPGRNIYLCDSFCGDEQARMNGLLIVEACGHESRP